MKSLVLLPFLAVAFAFPQLPEVTPPSDFPIQPPSANSTQPPADFPQPTPPSTNSTTLPPAPGAPSDAPMLPGITPPTNAPPPSENGTESESGAGSGNDQGGNNPQIPIPGSPIVAGGGARNMRALPIQLPVQYVVPGAPMAQQYVAVPYAQHVPVYHQQVPIYYNLH